MLTLYILLAKCSKSESIILMITLNIDNKRINRLNVGIVTAAKSSIRYHTQHKAVNCLLRVLPFENVYSY